MIGDDNLHDFSDTETATRAPDPVARFKKGRERRAPLPPAPPASETDAVEAEDEPVKPAFTSVDQWVENYLVRMMRVPLSTTSGADHAWDRQWWRHEAVVMRLEALWRSWEAARASKDPSAMSAWILQHLDPHMRVLMGPTGPMSRAVSEGGGELPRLPVDPVPDSARRRLGI